MLEVVTQWAPRPTHEKWRGDEYMKLLELQRGTCQRVGHRHVVVTDADLPGYDTIKVELPEPLLKAIISAQIAYVKQWSDDHPVVMVDMDVLIARPLGPAFDGTFDIGVTNREHPAQPIQNGVIYLAPGSKKWALKMFEKTLELCEHWWGSDQKALAFALAPVPRIHRVEERLGGARVAFLPCATHNFSAKHGVPKATPKCYAFHFKGESKQFAEHTARRHMLLPGMR